MKLEIRIENGKPILFWLDDPDEHGENVTCFTMQDMHNTSSKAYMRDLPKPETKEDYTQAFRVLASWSAHVLRHI